MRYLIIAVLLTTAGCIPPSPPQAASGRFGIENYTQYGHGLYLVTENGTKREWLCNGNGGLVEITK